MKNSEFRVWVAILALVIALGLFLGGFTLYNKMGIEEPLMTELYGITGVDKVSIQKERAYQINIELDKVDDIQLLYQHLVKTIEKKLDKESYELLIIDQPSEKLNGFYKKIQPAIYETLANHKFMWLDELIDQNTSEVFDSYSLLVDEKYMYIEVIDGDFYMYKILERPSAVKEN